MALNYVPAGRIPANEVRTKQDDESSYWKRLQQLTVFQEPSAVTSVAFCPKKPYSIASTSSVRLSLYDTIICEPMSMFSRFKQAVFGAKFRKDGLLIAVGGEEGKLRVFDMNNSTGNAKAPLRSVKTSAHCLRVVEFSQSGKSVYSMADDGIIKQWDLSDTGSTPSLEIKAHTDAIRAGVASNFNESIVISGGYDHKVKVWDLRATTNNEPTLEIDVGAPVESLTFLPSENLLATASTNIIKIYDISAGGRQLATIQQHHKTITSLSLDGNGKYLLSGGIDRRINVLNLTNFTITHSMSMAAPVLALAMSPDDNMLAVGMGSLLAIHRRVSLKEVVNAVKYQDAKSAMPNVTSVEIKYRGEDKKKQTIIAEPITRIQLDHVDRLLKTYKHAAALKKMTSHIYLRKKREEIVGWLQVLVHRRVIHVALSGQDKGSIIRLLRFLNGNILNNNYFDILRHVAVALFEVYAEEECDLDIFKQMKRLRSKLTKEQTIQKQISQTIGILEMIQNGPRRNQADDADDSMGVFGDVTVTTIIPDAILSS